MPEKFLSFLGTNKYVTCTYYQNDREAIDKPFVQEAIVQLHCSSWTSADQIVIFVTPAARQKNWNDDGHGQKSEGLHSRLRRLGLSCQIRDVAIPDGSTEVEIWEIFNVVCNELLENETVVFDITHALRSLPMLAMVVLQYVGVLRNVRLRGIYYGAFETLGSVERVKKIATAERRVPIFDLTPFARLADWAFAVDRLLSAGDAAMIQNLVRTEAVIPFTKVGPSARQKEAIAVKRLADRLFDFTKNLATCRGLSIARCAASLNKALNDCRNADLVPPLVPLLEKIRAGTAGFSGTDHINDGIRAARWCLDHNLVQQAYTILHETAVSFFLLKVKEKTDGSHPLDVGKREMVTGAAALLAQGKDLSDGRFPAGQEKLWRKIWNTMGETDENFRRMSILEQYRNDLNHAGIRKDCIHAKKFDKLLKEAIEWLEKVSREPRG